MAEIGYYSYKRRDWKVFPNKLNPFWRDFLLNLSEMLAIKDEEEKYIINIMSKSGQYFSTYISEADLLGEMNSVIKRPLNKQNILQKIVL
jgi:hypothetical protein